jgi:predicted TPR repeat methyltransferase
LNPLDLYARVEDLLGVKEAAPELYAHYLLALHGSAFDSLLDVGCGSGDFLRQMQTVFPDARMRGIDLSPVMVTAARGQGVEAEAIDLCDVSEKFDVVTAVFDMLNYLDGASLERLGRCVRERLVDGGLFLCDVNTLYGFEEVAVGAFAAEDSDRFVAIESDFEDGVYVSDFTLFEHEGVCWHKSSATIEQHYHTVGALEAALGLKMIECTPVSLYADEADKLFLVWQKG